MTIEIDNAVEADGRAQDGDVAGAGAGADEGRFRISLAAWANGLRLVEPSGTTLAEVRRGAGAHTNIPGLERWGWIRVDPATDPVADPAADLGNDLVAPRHRPGYGSSRGLRPDTVLRPTRAGERARRLWPQTLGAVEARWRDRFGSDLVDRLRAAAGPLTTSMPWAPPQVSAADGFRSRVIDRDPVEADPDRPLAAVLGQALTALTLQAEAGAVVSVSFGANLLHALDGGPLARRDLPARTGLSREAVAMATGFLVRRGLGTVALSGVVALSQDGVAALADHRRRVEAVSAAAPEALGPAIEEVLGRPEVLAAGLEPPAGGWRGAPPYLAQTRRLLADPVGALPRHPMVLHRGGWPDGS